LDLHEGQRKVLNRLLDGGENGFEHGISASQYQKVAKVSRATATRHLTDLLEKGCIVKLEGVGEIRGIRLKFITSSIFLYKY
jgi:Fic family protein